MGHRHNVEEWHDQERYVAEGVVASTTGRTPPSSKIDPEAMAEKTSMVVLMRRKLTRCWNLLSWTSGSNREMERAQAKFNVG